MKSDGNITFIYHNYCFVLSLYEIQINLFHTKYLDLIKL